jgi:hypothetical protein
MKETNFLGQVYVKYVEGATPVLKRFPTKKKAEAFIASFQKEFPTGTPDYNIDFMIEGQVTFFDGYWDA